MVQCTTKRTDDRSPPFLVFSSSRLTLCKSATYLRSSNSLRIWHVVCSAAIALTGTRIWDDIGERNVRTYRKANRRGRLGRGLLGQKVEAVVVDPASNWPLFAEKARELLVKDKVAVVFGCWTSVSRKSVLPVFEELNGLLFYPLEYEGEEASYNLFY